MQSTPELPQSTQAPVVTPYNSAAAPQANDIVRSLKPAETPLDFIRQNLKPIGPEVNPQAMADAELKKQEEVTKQTLAIEEPNFNAQPEVQKSNTEAITTSPEPEAELEDPLLSDASDTTAENFKRLRVKTKELSKTAKQLEEENKTLKSKVTEYETGTIVPEVLQTKENEIQRLSYYEKLVNFKGSKEYQDSFVKPVTELQSRLGEIAKDYEVPEEVLQEAMTINNRADLNRFLTSHFDEVGAMEVKDLVGQIKGIQTKALEAEKAPADAMARMQAENVQIAERKKLERVGTVVTSAKSAWVEALTGIQAEGQIPELTTVDNNLDHNEKVVKPIRTAAGAEYAKIVKMLAELGVESLPADLAKALAKSVLLAHASATAIASRGYTAKELSQIATNMKRTTSYERPAVGSANAPTGAGQQTTKPSTPQDAAAQHINSILSRGVR